MIIWFPQDVIQEISLNNLYYETSKKFLTIMGIELQTLILNECNKSNKWYNKF